MFTCVWDGLFKPSIGKYDKSKANFVYPELPFLNAFNFLIDLSHHLLKWNGEVLVALHLRTGFVDIARVLRKAIHSIRPWDLNYEQRVSAKQITDRD